jgi:hypothetical protein
VVLLPSAMVLLGERNWYFPSWLAWLPRIRHGAPEPAGAARPVGVGGLAAVPPPSVPASR